MGVEPQCSTYCAHTCLPFLDLEEGSCERHTGFAASTCGQTTQNSLSKVLTQEEIERCRRLGHYVGQELFDQLCDQALIPVLPIQHKEEDEDEDASAE